ncbi:MAG: type III pantothenate kinase [Flavobacteriaceae bacterium]
MNLIIDVGNTRVKAAVFKHDTLKETSSFGHDEFDDAVCKLQNKFQITNTIISKVASINNFSITKKSMFDNLLALSNATPIPFVNKYLTPKTLGIDRIALAAGAVSLYPHKNVLIIDAGTCITYDFVNSHKEYLGGAISPGIMMRYKALHHYTDGLPELLKKYPQNLVGSSTNASIHSGIVNGVVKEIDGIISDYRIKYSDLTIVLTGGDTNFLAKQLKSSIFANQNFLLQGLNSILIFNNSK